MARNKKSKYLISVIIPIYNVGEYLYEGVQSIIDQDIGFEDSIELILVNDGSTDNSGEICEKYALQYNNVVAINKENGGVSSARNAGLKVATSSFVAFFDGDDKLSSQFYRLLHAELARDEGLPFAVGRTKKFDAETGYHATDGKFNRTRIIDLSVTPYDIQTLQSPVLYRKAALRGIYFNEHMTHSEDSEFVNRVLMKSRGRYAVVREAIYYYRRRKDESSATGVAKNRRTYYLSMVALVESLLGAGADSGNRVVPQFVQYALMYQVGWRMRISSRPEALSSEDWILYKNSLKRAIYALDDDVVAHGGSSVRVKERRSIFAVKYASGLNNQYQDFKLSDENRIKLCSELTFCIHRFSGGREGVYISGSTLAYSPEALGLSLTAKINGRSVDLKKDTHTEWFMGDEVEVPTGLSFTVPVYQSSVLVVEASSGVDTYDIPVVYSSSAKLDGWPLEYRRLSDRVTVLRDRYRVLIFNKITPKIVGTICILGARRLATRGFSFVRRAANRLRH